MIGDLLPVLSAFAGAGAALLAVTLTARFQRKREERKARGDAIVEVIRAWGEAYRRAYTEDFDGYPVEVESAVASARVVMLARKKDSDSISKITSATTNTLNQAFSPKMIAAAQSALMHWHISGCSGRAAFQVFETKAAETGLRLP